jgi:hypothetical protein
MDLRCGMTGERCACGAEAVRTLCAKACCQACADAILEPTRERVIEREGLDGVVIRDGMTRPEHGPGMADCRCVSCGATMVAHVGDPCAYCAVAVEKMTGWQRQMVLDPELPDVADVRYDGACRGWAERLAVAVAAGIVTEHEARVAWRRAVRDVA